MKQDQLSYLDAMEHRRETGMLVVQTRTFDPIDTACPWWLEPLRRHAYRVDRMAPALGRAVTLALRSRGIHLDAGSSG
jgi:hypothetical protein